MDKFGVDNGQVNRRNQREKGASLPNQLFQIVILIPVRALLESTDTSVQ